MVLVVLMGAGGFWFGVLRGTTFGREVDEGGLRGWGGHDGLRFCVAVVCLAWIDGWRGFGLDSMCSFMQVLVLVRVVSYGYDVWRSRLVPTGDVFACRGNWSLPSCLCF